MKRISVLIIHLTLICIFSIQAQNPNDALRLSEPGIISNAGLLGMGNSGIAYNAGYSSGLENPAVFALTKRGLFSAGFFYNSLDNNVSFINNNTDLTQSSNHLSQISVAIPFPTRRGSMVFALGYNRIKDFNNSVNFNSFNSNNTSLIQDLTSLNDDLAYDLGLSYGVFNNDQWQFDETIFEGNLNQSGSIIDKGGIDTWNLSGAVEFARNLFVGATLNIYSGSFRRDKEYFEDDTRNLYQGETSPGIASNDFQSFSLYETIDWDLSGWDAKLGLLYKFNRFSQFGATIKLPTSYTIDEKYAVEAYSDFANNIAYSIEPSVSRIEYDIQTPFELGLGIAYGIAGVSISAQATLIDYTQMEFSDGLDAVSRNSNNRLISDQFRTVVNYSFGAEYYLPFPKIRVAAGFMMQKSPYKNDGSEFDRKYLTLGAGFIANRYLSFNVAYVHGWWETFGDNYGFNESRTFQDLSRDKLVFTLAYGI
jgi:hypothetical protein